MTEQGRIDMQQLVKVNDRRLFGFIRGRVKSNEDAEDILQDVWYQLSRILDTEPIAQVTAWLYRVARNRITDKYRKKKPGALPGWLNETEADEEIWIPAFLQEGNEAERSMEQEFFWKDLFEALDELPVKQKEVFVMHELENIPLEEIAKKTGENIKTIISRKHYAVKHLREQLEDWYNEIINN